MIFGERPPGRARSVSPWSYDVKMPPKRCYRLFPEFGLPLFFAEDTAQSQPTSPPGRSNPGVGMGSCYYTLFAAQGQTLGRRAHSGALPFDERAERILGTTRRPAFEHPLSPPKATAKIAPYPWQRGRFQYRRDSPAFHLWTCWLRRPQGGVRQAPAETQLLRGPARHCSYRLKLTQID